MDNKKGFTLVELLAVIVILAIILAIAVPGISGVIKSSTKSSFSSDAQLVLKAVDYKKLEDEAFDIALINKDNIYDLLKVSGENYSSVDVVEINGVTYVKLVGQGKWAGLTACGVSKNIDVVEDGNCGPDYIEPNITYSPNGSVTYIKSSTVSVTVTDDSLENTSLKYVWTNSATTPADEEYINSFTNGEAIAMPSDNGTFYLHVTAKDIVGNVAKTYQMFNLDNIKPVITLVGDSEMGIGVGSTYTDPGATGTDNIDTDITSKIIVTGTVNPNVEGTYTLTYNVSDEAGNAATEVTRTVNVVSSTYTFNYTGALQTWTVPATGKYKLEAWGAQGGKHISVNVEGGAGGYATGETLLNAGDIINIYVGGKGADNTRYYQGAAGGFNGGGKGGTSASSYPNGGAGGGGATDFRLSDTNLANRIIVAGGGGGGGTSSLPYGAAGIGGGLSGIVVYYPDSPRTPGGGGTQSSGGAGGCYVDGSGYYCGTAGTLGTGGIGGGGNISNAGSGGGGGYYGGGGGGCIYGGGGGSSFVGTTSNSQTIAGNATMPNPAGGTMTGNLGNGYARITFIGQ